MEIIVKVFAGTMISEGDGKIAAIAAEGPDIDKV